MNTQTSEFYFARISNANRWVPACGGTETPFKSRSGITLLYCWNPATNQHAYLNVDTDIILTDDEANFALAR